MTGLRVGKTMESLYSPPQNRRCWFLIRPEAFFAEPEAVVQALRTHPLVHRVKWSSFAPTAVVHMKGPALDRFRSHVSLLAALLERLMPRSDTGGLLLALALHDFHPEPELLSSLAVCPMHRLPIYLRIQKGNDPDHSFVVAIHRPNPHTDLVFQVRPDCPAGEWAGLPTETLEAGTPIGPSEFFAAFPDPREFADSLHLLNG